MSWFADPGKGNSYIAYCGGGGKARTGVNNYIVILEDDYGPHKISTGDIVGVAIHIYQNPKTGKVWMVVALDDKIHRYRMPSGELDGVLDVEQLCSSVTVNAMADILAVGCEDGPVKIYSISDQAFAADGLVDVLTTHKKAVCAMAFSLRNGRLITSAKDGTACIYQNGRLISGFKCSVQDDQAPPALQRRQTQVLVRGCAFADMDGKVAITVASPRRGRAFLARWAEPPAGGGFKCVDRTPCSKTPVSAMSLSQDASLLTLGSTDGSVTFWSVEQWKPLKIFSEVHHLPVTCIAARPYPVPLQGEENGVEIHARSASADSQLACLTMQRRAPKSTVPGAGGGTGFSLLSTMTFVNRILYVVILAWLLSPIVQEAKFKCGSTAGGLGPWRRCIMDEVIIAPHGRVGVDKMPY